MADPTTTTQTETWIYNLPQPLYLALRDALIVLLAWLAGIWLGRYAAKWLAAQGFDKIWAPPPPRRRREF